MSYIEQIYYLLDDLDRPDLLHIDLEVMGLFSSNPKTRMPTH